MSLLLHALLEPGMWIFHALLGLMLSYWGITSIGLIDLDIDLPDVNLPDVDVPDIDLPEIDLPELDLPQIDIPGIDLPHVSVPHFEIPDIDLPEVDLPAVDLPNLDMDLQFLHSDIPDLPSAAAPAAVLDGVDLPDLDAPAADVAELDAAGDADSPEAEPAATSGSSGGHGPFASVAIGILKFVGIGIVPAPLVASIMASFAWILGLAKGLIWRPDTVQAVAEQASAPMPLAGLLVNGVILLIAFGLTAVMVRPLFGMFGHETQHAHTHLVGQVCRIRTITVDAKVGQAEIRLNGVPALLSVRCSVPNSLDRGQDAIIVGYSKSRNVYEVRPLDLPEADGSVVEQATG